MKLYRINKLMKAWYGNELNACIQLPVNLSVILASGLTEQCDCVFLKALFEKCMSTSMDDFPDRTGYECFVNHIHVNDFIDSNLVQVAVAFLAEVSKMLVAKYPGCDFRGLLGVNGNNVTVRFHRMHPGEEWLSGDMEEYSEGICEYKLGDIGNCPAL